MTLNRQIILYGIGGPEKQYAVLGYYQIFEDASDIITTMMREASMLRAKNPSVRTIYAVDNSYRIRKEYRESKRLNSIEGWVIFKDLLERYGFKLPL